MAHIHSGQKDFSLRWPSLTALYAGICCGIPAILVGHTLYIICGMKGAILSLFLGSFILFAIGTLLALKGFQKRMPFIDLVETYLGKKGSQLAGLSFTVSLTGWFSLQLEFISKNLLHLFPHIPYSLCCILLGAGIMATVLKGLKGMGHLSSFLLPFIFIMLTDILFKLYDPTHHIPASSFNVMGLPLTLASSLAVALDAPTFLYKARQKKDIWIACSFVFCFFCPFMGLIGITFGIFSKSNDFIQTLFYTSDPLWTVCFAFFIMASGWITNNGNLFSIVWASKPFSKNISFKKRILFFGTVGTLLSLLKGLEHLETYLSFIGILESSVGACLLIHLFFGKRPSLHPFFFFLCIMTSLYGILSQCHIFPFTGFGFLDTFLLTSFLSTLTCLCTKKHT